MPCRAADGYFGETAIRSLVYPQMTDHQRMQQISTMLLHSNQNRSHDDIQYKNNRHRNQDMYLRQNGLQQRQPVFLLACSRILQARSGKSPQCCSYKDCSSAMVEFQAEIFEKPTASTPFAELEPANVGIYTLLQREE